MVCSSYSFTVLVQKLRRPLAWASYRYPYFFATVNGFFYLGVEAVEVDAAFGETVVIAGDFSRDVTARLFCWRSGFVPYGLRFANEYAATSILLRVAGVDHDAHEVRDVLEVWHLALEGLGVGYPDAVATFGDGRLACRLLLCLPVDGMGFEGVHQVLAVHLYGSDGVCVSEIDSLYCYFHFLEGLWFIVYGLWMSYRYRSEAYRHRKTNCSTVACSAYELCRTYSAPFIIWHQQRSACALRYCMPPFQGLAIVIVIVIV